jgi:hypothetical protein
LQPYSYFKGVINLENIKVIEKTLREKHKKIYYFVIAALSFLLFYQAYRAGISIGKFSYYITH